MNRNINKSPVELRLRAEKRLREKRDKSPSPGSELQRLVHELEVHQIELEMQNEELQQARSDLESYLSQYTDLYDFAPVSYFTLGRDGKILQANLTGANLLGVERSALANRPFGVFVSSEYRAAFNAFLELVFKSQIKETCEAAILKKEGEFLFVHIEALTSDSGQQCRLAVIDITERKQIEKTLRESERKFRALFETMTQGVMYKEPNGKIISVNPAAERILGLSIDQTQGITWPVPGWRVIHEDGSEFSQETLPSDVALGTATAVENVVMGVISPKTDGCIWLKINAVPQFISGEDEPSQVILTLENITDFKRMAVYNTLTPREKEVFKLLVKGGSRQIIAGTLNVSPKTVDKHKENLMEKLILRETEELVQFAKLIGVIRAW
jgi:PAS domain S-box-containing protein